MIITRTPYRVSFLGGGSDYAIHYTRDEAGGAVLTSSIDKYCYLSARWLPPFFGHKHRVAWSEIELPNDVPSIRHPSVRAVLQHLKIERGVEIHHAGDLPARAGLGSSSAFTVGLLNAMHALEGRMACPRALADEAIFCEQMILQEAGGLQDQIECAHGGLNLVEFDASGWRVKPVILPAGRRRELEASLMLYFTGTVRSAPELAAAQMGRTWGHGATLRDMVALTRDGLAVLTGGGPLAEFGRLLDEGWHLKRSLSPAVSTPEIDGLYAAARNAGAVGGKLLGAGGGGFMLLFAPPEAQGRLRRALDGVLEVPFRFESGGSRVVYVAD